MVCNALSLFGDSNRAGKETLELLEAVLLHPNTNNVMFIGAFRPNKSIPWSTFESHILQKHKVESFKALTV